MDDSSPFDSYEQDLVTLSESIRDELSQSASKQDKDEKSKLLRRVEMELEEADEILGQMEIEVQTTAGPARDALAGRLRNLKQTVAAHKSSLKQAYEQADRDELLGTSNSAHVVIDVDPATPGSGHAQAQRLLSQTERLAADQQRLEESHRVALETGQVGTGILEDLRTQRERLEHTRDNLYGADSAIDRASGSVSKMVRRAYQQKAVTYLIIALLIFLILYVLFAKIL